MKRLFLLSFLCLFAAVGWVSAQTNKYVEVMYFHGKQRCLTCRAIEKYTKEVVYNDFAKLVKSGKVRYREIDISTAEGEKIADKYHVTWSSLYVNGWTNGKETRNNLTRMGFKYARSNTKQFKSELKGKINQLLK